MKFLEKLPKKKLFAFFVLAALFLLVFFNPLRSYELITYDLRFQLRPPQKTDPQVVIIEISDDTLQNLGKWPLPRDFHASLVEVLSEYGAGQVIFDVLFSEAADYDGRFAKSIKEAANVYLAQAFYLEEPLKREKFYFFSEALLAGLIEDLKNSCRGLGHINVFIDSDGKARSVPLFIKYKGSLIPQLALRAACGRLGADPRKVEFKNSALIIDGKLRLPLLNDGSFAVNYPGKWTESFRHFSYFEILKSYSQIKQGFEPDVDLTLLKGKTCFIGLTAAGTSDLRAMPLEKIYPMLGLQASVFNSILTANFIRQARPFINALAAFLLFIFSAIICLRLSAQKAFLGIFFLAVFYAFFCWGLFVFFGFWLEMFLPLFIIVMVYVSATSYRFFLEAKRRQLLEKELEIARQIQRSFLPEEAEGEFAAASVSTFIQPAKFVGGDLYDIYEFPDGRVGIFIGDVSGKGVPAALIMAQTISFFRIFSRQDDAPALLLEKLNRELCGKFSGRFVTALYMVIDRRADKLTVSSAGHGPLLIYHSAKGVLEEPGLGEGLPLGVMEGAEFPEITLALSGGDKLVVFTDGAGEARNIRGEDFGIPRIKEVIIRNASFPAAELTRLIRENIFKHSWRAPQHDDITIIIAESRKENPDAQ